MKEETIAKVEDLQKNVKPVLQQATAIVIVTAADYESAANFTKEIKGAMKRVDAFFDGMIQSAHNTWKTALAQKATFADPLKAAEKTVKDKQLAWSAEQERIRRIEEDRLNAIEQERARKERERQEAAARLQREKEQAAQREADEARRKAAEATNAKERERLQREAEARQKEAAAAAAKAQAKEDAAAAVVGNTVTVASIAPKIKGQSISTKTKARIIDAHAAALALILFPDWAAYIEINQGELDKFANRTEGQVPLAGVEWYKASTLASTSK